MHRTLLTLILAFCGEHPRFPHPFLDCGYDDDIIVEPEMQNRDRDEVAFDVVLNSQDQGIAVLIEAKGGMSHEEAHERFRDQRERYNRVTTQEVEQQSGVSLPEEGPIEFDISYWGPDDVAAELVNEVEEGDSEVVVSLDLVEFGSGYALRSCRVVRNHLRDDQLNEALNITRNDPVPVPDHFFPFDENTPPLEVAFEVMPYIRALYDDEGRETFQHSELAERAIRVWPYFSREYRESIGSVVRRVVLAISKAPGDPKYRWDNDARAWRFEEPADVRARSTPPRLKKPAWEYLANEWDVDQIDAFLDG